MWSVKFSTKVATQYGRNNTGEYKVSMCRITGSEYSRVNIASQVGYVTVY